jgi:DNA-binding FadR family transcriptional regulator
MTSSPGLTSDVAAPPPDALVEIAGNERITPSIIYRAILHSIRAGQLKPGARLANERALARQFKTSRATVRSALSMMESQHLIVRRVGAGTFLSPDADGIFERIDQTPIPRHAAVPSFLEIIEARLLFEPAMVGLVVARASEDDLREMDRALDEVMAATRWLAFKEAIYAVHGAIFAASKNRFLTEIFAAIVADRRAVRFDGRGTDTDVPQPVREQAHLDLSQIVGAIRARRATRAERLMKDHLLRIAATVNIYN